MSNPWGDFERSMPKREFDAAQPEPEERRPDRPATPEPVVPTTAATPSAWDQIVAPERPPMPTPESMRPRTEERHDDLSVFAPLAQATAPAQPPKQRPPRPPRQGGTPRWLMVAVGSVVGVAAIAGAVFFIGSTLSQGEAVAEPTPTPEETSEPTAPLSSLSKNPDSDLSFRVNLSSMSGGDYYISNATSGFAAEGSGWTKDTEYEENGFVGYRQESTQCTVRWTQYASETDSVDDYAPSIAAMIESGGSEDYTVEQYGYWSGTDSVKPTGVAEVVESRVDTDDVSVIVAARAVTGIDDVSVIWSMCDDPDDLDSFVESIRSQVGFIIVKDD